MLGGLHAVPPAEATTAEGNLKAFIARRRKASEAESGSVA